MTLSLSEAIILAGGKGTRLRSVTADKIPKGLTPIKNRPILEWELELLAREGINHAVLALGHHADTIKSHFGNSFDTDFGTVDITISLEKEKLGSGGAVKLASQAISTDRALIMNGDVLTNANLEQMRKIHMETGASATMLLVNMTSPYGIAKVQNNFIVEFVEKPRLDIPIHAGFDIVESDVFSRFPEKGQMEDTIFMDMAKEKSFAYYLLENSVFWMSVDTEKDYQNANLQWPGL